MKEASLCHCKDFEILHWPGKKQNKIKPHFQILPGCSTMGYCATSATETSIVGHFVLCWAPKSKHLHPLKHSVHCFEWHRSRWGGTACRERNRSAVSWGTSSLVRGWGSRWGILQEADRAMLSSKNLQKFVACRSGASGGFPVSKISLLLMPR